MRNPLLKLFAILLLSVFLTPAAMADYASENALKYEMRGAWIATVWGLDWPPRAGVDAAATEEQKRALNTMLEGLSYAGFNAVFFQVRPMADAFYTSSYEPWSTHLTGARDAKPAYDPLQYCVERCHSLGLECHAWINPFRINTKTPLNSATDKLTATFSNGKQKNTILNPALADTRRRICNVVAEIALTYDIDGVVFDDYFYAPDFIVEDSSAPDWQLYRESGSDLSFADWRRNNVNLTIHEVATTLAGIKQGKIRFGVAPQGIGGGNGVHADAGIPSLTGYGVLTADSQYAKIYCDPVAWLIDGDIDYISPQIYWPTDHKKHPYGGLARWWNDVAAKCSRHCFPSVTISVFAKDNSGKCRSEALRQVEINRTAASDFAPGTIFYSAACISGPKSTGFGDRLAGEMFCNKALMPPMTWKGSPQPHTIDNLSLSGSTLCWNANNDTDDDCRYTIYALPAGSEIAESSLSPDHLIGISYSRSFEVPERYSSKDFTLAVAPYDRYGNEGQPAALSSPQTAKNAGNKAKKSSKKEIGKLAESEMDIIRDTENIMVKPEGHEADVIKPDNSGNNNSGNAGWRRQVRNSSKEKK